MNKKWLYFLIGILSSCLSIFAQSESGEMIRGKLASESGEELGFATVLEVDQTGRVVSNTQTDLNGAFSMKIKSTRNKLKITYIGFVTQEIPIGSKRDFSVVLKEDNVLQEVVVVAKQTASNGGMDIPVKEVSFAMQRISAKAFEGMQVSSIDDALQGHIAGLDIVGSGNVGVGTQMRIRGIASLSTNSNPLIVINGIPRDDISASDFDFASATDQQFSDLLMISVADIKDVVVLKDAGATAIWGARGASGVLLITTNKGAKGPTRVNYTYKYMGQKQGQGMKMLNGDDYTMLMKQAYFNPNQSNSTSNIPEFNYDPTFSEYKYYNNNTDWRNEVLQYGQTNEHNLTISGGGDRAQFRVSGGMMSRTGTVIGQKWDRLTSRMQLDYYVSDRIMFSSEAAFTYSDNAQNWDDARDTDDENLNNSKSILYIAYKKMPNMAVYNKDANGQDLDSYYNMLSNSVLKKGAQGKLRNPVAQARMAVNNNKSYDINPVLRLRYDFMNPENIEKMLRYDVYVSFLMNNSKTHKFLPKELSSEPWNSQYQNINRADDHDSESFGIRSENRLQWKPDLGADHSFQAYASLQTSSGKSSSQDMLVYGFPTGGIQEPSAPSYVRELKSGIGQWSSLAVSTQLHYAYQSRYVLDLTLRREGSTKFGENRKYGNFPGVSLRWNISDETFMRSIREKGLTMLSFRPSWGIVGSEPAYEYLHFSKYAPWSAYLGNSTIRPENIRLSNLKWETTTEYNWGMDVELMDGKFTMDANLYRRLTEDLLFPNAPIPSSSGFSTLTYRNVGSMKNLGWEVNLHGNKFIRIGDFSVDGYFNLSNSSNTLVSLSSDILEERNSKFEYDKRNAPYLQILKEGHAYGSIYGFRYKGVYQYSMDNTDLVNSNYTLGTAPVARNAQGEIIRDAKGSPLPMYYNYGPKGINYQFVGGDAIYEDINHDGNIDELDIVYLGNSNPKLTGGYGLTLRWKSLSCNAYFNFRYGNKIINTTRREAENMLTDNNQSIATNWRWRQEGDMTNMPRALHDYGYNSLPSDRYVEDGSFLRFKTLTFNYNVPSKFLNKFYVKQMNLYLTFTNLMCFTKYQGEDPEVGWDRWGVSRDESITPRPREFNVGITLGF
ncbi:MAG: SusC/RagA family TonB-linked outer membrane protein [Dysgonamonadaceae bacterium]|jgi:TonB-linked SusC/RagA family outer membrane protein|nr:SusC/RagA family TonB-linked outer membrane protein [Dysgonamonadaceae bacterium]